MKELLLLTHFFERFLNTMSSFNILPHSVQSQFNLLLLAHKSYRKKNFHGGTFLKRQKIYVLTWGNSRFVCNMLKNFEINKKKICKESSEIRKGASFEDKQFYNVSSQEHQIFLNPKESQPNHTRLKLITEKIRKSKRAF